MGLDHEQFELTESIKIPCIREIMRFRNKFSRCDELRLFVIDVAGDCFIQEFFDKLTVLFVVVMFIGVHKIDENTPDNCDCVGL